MPVYHGCLAVRIVGNDSDLKCIKDKQSEKCEYVLEYVEINFLLM